MRRVMSAILSLAPGATALERVAGGGEVIYKGIPGTGAGDVNARVFKGVPGAGVDADADAWAGVAEDASSLLKMEDTLRRQLENKRDWVFSYDFADAEPTAKPTSSPTFTPCDVEGEYRYYLALYDYGGDGWEGATYTLYKYVGVRQGEQILTGTVETGSEEVINFCLPNGLYAVDFGGGSDDGEIGIQFLPDDLQMITTCTGPCVERFLAVDGIVMPPTEPPTASNLGQPTAFDASQTAWMYLSFLVDGLNGEALISEAGFSAFAYAINDLLQAAGDDTASIEAVILMDTCAMAGHNSNDDCLDAMVGPPAIADGAMLERILYWADYFGLDLGDDFTVVSIVSDPEPYWVYAPTAAPPAKPTAAPTTTTTTAAPTPVTTTAAPPVTDDSVDSGSSSKKKSSDDDLDSGAMAGIIVAVVVVLLIIAALVYFKSRESEATARKDSWDMSQDFTDEQNLPASDQISEQPAGDQPQALQKITQAAEL
ncbi:hypothetical protein JL721_437 [Aureococcus anophagefferens]|nr:hypothetical protein JL721_437 [Aureococcus anophagefferens]